MRANGAWALKGAVALALAALSGQAMADADSEALRRQIEAMQRQIDQMKAQLDRVERQKAAPVAPAPRAPAAVGIPAALPRNAPPGASFVELYGHLDVSVDSATKGIADKTLPDGTRAVGRLGWMPQISSNLSRVGVRGARVLGNTGLRGIFQIETQVDVSATPGPSTVPDNTIKGAWASRNSYVGFEGGFGAVKAGKSDAPYKLSTARMDPFSATVGDYNAIIGNTGGDNRAEFDTRLSHAIWYESPHFGPLRFAVLFSPSMNRSTDNSIPPSGEPDCAGGNQPPCTDGSIGNVYSTALTYDSGPLYAIAAYEMHKDVNRQGDEAAGGGPAPLGSVDIADEYAYKAGVQFRAGTGTTINAIWERMVRKAPVDAFNERTRSSYWLALTQKFGRDDDINLGWGHAGKTPGDPGFGPVDNRSNLYAVGYKHHFDKRTQWYAVYARQANHDGAHFDLGASGHGITTDCHDAAGNCFFGGTVQAVSVGAIYDF